MKTSIAIIISGIVIAISIVVSTKMYVDANKYTFFDGGSEFCDYAISQDGERYSLVRIDKTVFPTASDIKHKWIKDDTILNQLP
tara:strand:- start:1418 stop:1669 length:252 start_codon:yes stop_codon:yes gene_type:complete